MEKRRQQRSKRRLTCEVVVDGKSHAGIVRDHSPAGIFVQTRVHPPTHSVVEVVFRGEGEGEEIRVEAGVARERIGPGRLQASVPGGLGLELLDPPAELHELLASSLAASHEESGPAEDGEASLVTRTFRVRVKERERSTSRVITVRCESAQAARARALRQVGPGWKVADVQEL